MVHVVGEDVKGCIEDSFKVARELSKKIFSSERTDKIIDITDMLTQMKMLHMQEENLNAIVKHLKKITRIMLKENTDCDELLSRCLKSKDLKDKELIKAIKEYLRGLND